MGGLREEVAVPPEPRGHLGGGRQAGTDHMHELRLTHDSPGMTQEGSSCIIKTFGVMIFC